MIAAEQMEIMYNILGMTHAIRCNYITFFGDMISHVTSWPLKDSIIEVIEAVFNGNYVVTQMNNNVCMIICGFPWMCVLMFKGFGSIKCDRPFNRAQFDHMCNIADNQRSFSSMTLLGFFLEDRQFLLFSNSMH